MAEKPNLNSVLNKAADRKTRRAALRAALFLGLAVVAAVGSALLLTRYMEARTAAARVPTSTVIVAAIDLPVGTEIRAEHVRAVDWPAASAPEGAFSDPSLLHGKVVSARTVKGEPVLVAKLAGSGGGLSALLPPGMRAAAVRVDDVVGVAGFIHPGDTVDVIATMRHEGGNNTTAKVILQRIKVRGGQGARPALQVAGEGRAGDRGHAHGGRGGIGTPRARGGAGQNPPHPAQRRRPDVVATRGVHRHRCSRSPSSPSRSRHARARPGGPPREGPREERSEVVEILRGDLYERRDFQPKGRPSERAPRERRSPS